MKRCYKHPDKKAVAVINKEYPVCDDCVTDAMAYILNSGGMVGMSVRGKPVALLIPQDRKNNWKIAKNSLIFVARVLQ